MTKAEKSREWYLKHKDDPTFKDKQRQRLRESRARRKHTPEFKEQKAKHDLAYRLKVRDSEEFRKKRNAFNVKYRTINPETPRRSVRNWRSDNPEKVAAHEMVRQAIRRGALKRPISCGRCGIAPSFGRDGRSGLHAHHHDYAKPLDVFWLCAFCHAKERRKYA